MFYITGKKENQNSGFEETKGSKFSDISYPWYAQVWLRGVKILRGLISCDNRFDICLWLLFNELTIFRFFFILIRGQVL